uniref:Uncharacterized protein n=1 Tax=Tanacetum cinerariifolium TaxID=118510 RepID=A0A699Q6F6_TANCI|nr:hypothetical protein [Tanacetum cinerariifolium]
MASNPENVRLNVLMKLQEALYEEAILEEQIITLMHRFPDRFTDRRVEINNLMVLHDHPLIDYGKLSAYWKAFFVSLGGPYGSCGTALYLMLLLLPARRSLMI